MKSEPIFKKHARAAAAERGHDRALQFDLAYELMKQYGVVAADDGGEDSQGRSKPRLQSPDELVSRCMGIADIFVSRAIECGWMTFDVPDIVDEIKKNAALSAIGSSVIGRPTDDLARINDQVEMAREVLEGE